MSADRRTQGFPFHTAICSRRGPGLAGNFPPAGRHASRSPLDLSTSPIDLARSSPKYNDPHARDAGLRRRNVFRRAGEGKSGRSAPPQPGGPQVSPNRLTPRRLPTVLDGIDRYLRPQTWRGASSAVRRREAWNARRSGRRHGLSIERADPPPRGPFNRDRHLTLELLTEHPSRTRRAPTSAGPPRLPCQAFVKTAHSHPVTERPQDGPRGAASARAKSSARRRNIARLPLQRSSSRPRNGTADIGQTRQPMSVSPAAPRSGTPRQGCWWDGGFGRQSASR